MQHWWGKDGDSQVKRNTTSGNKDHFDLSDLRIEWKLMEIALLTKERRLSERNKNIDFCPTYRKAHAAISCLW